MEESLLLQPKEKQHQRVTWEGFGVEMKRICEIAGPMVAVTLSQWLLQVVAIMMVGHLGELYLSSTALAISLAAVTGFSVLMLDSCRYMGGSISILILLCLAAFMVHAISILVYYHFVLGGLCASIPLGLWQTLN